MSAPKPSPRSELIGGTLAGRFVVERPLGAGGMGEVYLATDTVLRRRVAIKRVAARWRDDPQRREQLLQEAERCSSLNHPNIAAIYDVLQDEATAELVIVMEYVDGVTLRPSIGTPVDRETFFRIALPCAEAIAAAHQRGIIHGDLKPENIMLGRNLARAPNTYASAQPEVFADSGMVKVLDFGLAIHSDDKSDETTLTRDALERDTRGTLGYVAPEVLRGSTPTPPADVFALGVIFYELLTGKHPFMSVTNAVTVDRTLHLDPKLPADAAGGEPVAAIVRRMLAKEVSERYSTAREALKDLQGSYSGAEPKRRKWIAGGVLLLALTVGVSAGLLWRQHTQKSTISRYKLIAVLPFRPIGSQPGLQALSDGLTETASAKLARIADSDGLQLVAPADMSKIRGDADEALDKARHDLGVDLAFVPSMEQDGDRVRLNFRLVDTLSRREIDGDSVIAPADDLFALEDSAVERMAALLDVKVRAQARRELAERGTQNREAYENYLKGIGYLRGFDDPANSVKAVNAFQTALASDSNFSLAYAGLGLAYWQQYVESKQPHFVDQAHQMCSHAEDLANQLAPPHICLGTVALGTGKYEDAVHEFSLATNLDADSDDAVLGLAQAQKLLSRPQEAEATFKRAIALRPQYWAGYSRLARFYIEQSRYKEAAGEFELAAQHAPQNTFVFMGLGGAYIYLGEYELADRALRRSIDLSPRYQAFSNLGFVYLRQRRFDEAIGAFEQAFKLGAQDYEIWGHLADAYFWAPGKRNLAPPRYQKAIAMAQEALNVNPKDYNAQMLIAHYYAATGQKDAAQSHLRAALGDQQQNAEVFYYAALVSNELGDPKEAVRWLRTALAHGYSAAEIKRDVEFDNLRNDAEVQKLLAGN